MRGISVAEREELYREEFRGAFESICPHVLGNEYVRQFPHPKQAVGLGMHARMQTPGVYHLLYGGAAGPGKSSWLLMAAAQYVKHPEFAAILFRRTHTELMEPGALLSRAIEWWYAMPGVHYNGSLKLFTFPSGAKVSFGYMRHASDYLRYQSSEFQMAGFDELTQWPSPFMPDYVGNSRLRRPQGSKIPLRYLAASNPGGPGHRWVMQNYIGEMDHEGNMLSKAPYDYLPGTMEDNPSIDQASYRASLMHLPHTIREQLLNGDWRARDPGDYFRAEWFGPLLDPHTDAWPDRDCVRVRWWDLAASESEDAAWTAGVLMSRHRSGVRAVEHCNSFKATPGRRDAYIVAQAQLDGFGVTVGLEVEPGSGGIAQVYHLAKTLMAKGHSVAWERPRVVHHTDESKILQTKQARNITGKAGRADPVSACTQRGHIKRGEDPDTQLEEWGVFVDLPITHHNDGIRLFHGPWTQAYLDIIEPFPQDSLTCDEVDATSGAFAWLESNSFGRSQAPHKRKQAHEELIEPGFEHATQAEEDDLKLKAGRHYRETTHQGPRHTRRRFDP